MTRSIALVDYDPSAGAFGAVFPDAPGCTAMGGTFDEAHDNAVEALREWAADQTDDLSSLPRPRDILALRADSTLQDDFTSSAVAVSVPVFLDGGRPVRVNVSIKAGLVAEIDDAARALGLTRSGFLASAARDKIAATR